MKGLNWLGVAVALIVSEGIGMLWYGKLFEARWIALSNPIVGADMTTTMIIGAIAVLIPIIGLAWLVRRLNQESWGGGLRAGIVAGVAFAATAAILDTIYSNRGPELMMIQAGFVIIFYAVSGAIVGGLKLPVRAAQPA